MEKKLSLVEQAALLKEGFLGAKEPPEKVRGGLFLRSGTIRCGCGRKISANRTACKNCVSTVNPDHVQQSTRAVNESGQARTMSGAPAFLCECPSLSCTMAFAFLDFQSARKTLGHSRDTEGCLFIVHQDCPNWARLEHDTVLKFGTAVVVCERRLHPQILLSE